MAKISRKAPDEMQQFKGQFGGAGGFNPSALVRKNRAAMSGYARGTSRVRPPPDTSEMGTDNVPAMLTPGEGVANVGAMQMPGMRKFIRAANKKGIKRMEGGGMVDDPRKLFAGSKGVQELAKGGTAHPGFKAVQSKIASRSGVGKERAGAILAAATRRASPAAKRANPRLKRVKG